MLKEQIAKGVRTYKVNIMYYCGCALRAEPHFVLEGGDTYQK